MMKRGCRLLTIMLLVLLPTTVLAAPSEAEVIANAERFGIWTLLPPLLAILLAFVTKNVVLSLFLGAISGCFLLSLDSGHVFAIVNSFIDFSSRALSSLADPWNAGIVLQVLAIGGLIALIGKMGGAKAVAEKLATKAKSPRSTGLITWVLGLFVFFDDYANSLIVGPIMRPVSDKIKMSREKLAFIVDATAAPIAGLAIISTWVGYELSQIKIGYEAAGFMNESAFEIFIKTIPFRFYNILMLAFVVLTTVLLRDFGPMLKAEKRARAGKVFADSAKLASANDSGEFEPDEHVKLKMMNAIIPIGALIVFSIIGFYYNGLNALGEAPNTGSFIRNIALVFGEADASIVIFQAALFSGIIALVMGVSQRIFTVKDGINYWIEGNKSLIMTGVILLLAWSLSSVIGELGTRFFIIKSIPEDFAVWLVPSIIFVIGSCISFATGTSYGTMGILMPLAVPFAAGLSGNNEFIMLLSTSAVLTGAILGDHCSPISDTTILSSMGASCDHVDHVRTQLPYAIFIGIVSIIVGYIPASLLGMKHATIDNYSSVVILALILILVSIGLIIGFLFVFGKSVNQKDARESKAVSEN